MLLPVQHGEPTETSQVYRPHAHPRIHDSCLHSLFLKPCRRQAVAVAVGRHPCQGGRQNAATLATASRSTCSAEAVRTLRVLFPELLPFEKVSVTQLCA